MTLPSATATMGVPIGAAMSTPACRVPQRVPKLDVNVPTAGRTNSGRRAAASRAARSSLKRWPLASRLLNWERSVGAATLRTWGASASVVAAVEVAGAN